MSIQLNARDFRIISEITKAEPQADGSLLLEGVATSEAVDAEGEVMDYPTTKAAMLAWRGNVREQHDPRKAVGRALEILPDDETKRIPIKVMVSAGARDTQAKVIDGTLKFFSIGGRAKAKELDKVAKRSDGKPAVRLFMERISEVSLVDSGCNPDTGVAVVKADGEQFVAVDLVEEVTKINKPSIEEEAGKFKVVDSDGHVYGTHDNEPDAKKQLAALYAAKGREEKVMEEANATPENPVEKVLEIEKESPQAMHDRAVKMGASCGSSKADGSADPTPDVATEPPPIVKQEDTPPEKVEEPPKEPAGEPPATEKVATEPASDGGLVVSGLVEKVEAMTGELATLKADIATKGEENATLRKQVSDLEATVEKFGKRVVEPGTPIYKGPDGKPTTQPQGTKTDGAISSDRIAELVKASNGDPAVLHRELSMELAQAQVRKALTGK